MAKKLGNKNIAKEGAKTRFVKGDKRINRNGRPRLLPNLQEILADELGEVTHGTTATQKIIRRMKVKAYYGDIRAAEFLMERGYGRVVQGMDIKTNQEIQMPVINVYTGAAPSLSQSEDKVDITKEKK